jgi:hypothetical protein
VPSENEKAISHPTQVLGAEGTFFSRRKHTASSVQLLRTVFNAKRDVYRTSASEDLIHLTSVPVQDWSFTATAPAYSVTT